jgi:hypothetical protein
MGIFRFDGMAAVWHQHGRCDFEYELQEGKEGHS